ncbi:hypothetical protein [uncultured Proteiniphilum sp.]|uniref:hypothetical protein n=1 Tax=uncultured Proteiniphilum sp. TaxID=497637 RepID=UPI00260D1CC1|nr:hypothetical protein [uncultured Proteiniphilum sp.]
MKKIIILLFILIHILLISCMQKNGKSIERNDVVIENEQFKLVIGSDAITKSLILKSTNEECLMHGEKIAIFSVTQERPYHNEIKLGHPNKKKTFQADTIYREGNKLIVGFEWIPYKAVFLVKETPAYIGFSLEDFITEGIYPSYLKITPPPATEVCLLQLPVRNRENFGEWLNVSWDNKAAINVLGTDEYAYIDFEKRHGYNILRASAIKDIKFKGTGAALIVSETNKLLDNIAQIEEDFNLPKGVESRRSDLINASYYWTTNINPGNVDLHIKYTLMGGFRAMSIYYPAFEGFGSYDLIGNYEIDKKLYPNGKEDLRKMLDKIKAAGITPGVHLLHSHIGRRSKYVTPVPDYRLNLVRTFNLSENLGSSDSILFVEQNPDGSTMADGCRVLKVGTELISYKNYTTTRPYMFTGCVRGIDNTIINSLPKGHSIGILDVSEFGATSVYIDQRTSLQDEIAEKIVNIYDAGFQFFYFDGSEGVNPPFGINVALAQYKVFKRLNPQPLFAEGAAKTHFSWHMLSGGNAFDVFSPEVLKEETRKWPAEEAPRMRQDFTRINFGWLGYWVPSETTIGTQPDMLEYVTSVAAAWDCPISIHANLRAFEIHPRTPDNMEVVRRWEEVRAKHWLTEDQKKRLQNLEQEHHLLLDEEGRPELVPYEQITDVAGSSKEVRAFIFQRKGEYYVVYWHISDNKKLLLPVKLSDITLYKTLGQEESIITDSNDNTIIPVSDRRYIKINNLTKEEILNIFATAKIIN